MAVLDNVTLTISLGFGSGPLAAAPSFTDISAFSRGFSTSRGRSSVLDRFDAATGTIVVENLDGRFDPINTSSPYTPNLKIGTPVRIQVVHSAVTYTLFRGMVDSWPIQYSNAGQYSELAIPITDLFPILAGFNLEGITYPEQTTGARVTEILDDVGWPAGLRSITGATALVAGGTLEAVTAAEHLEEVASVEAGTFFIAGDGTATFQGRTSGAGLASTATFGTGGGEIEFDDFARAYDRDQLHNIVKATGPETFVEVTPLVFVQTGGFTQTATDATSVIAHGPLTLEIAAPFENDNAAKNVAEWQVGRLANTINRITQLSIDPDKSQAAMWPVAAGTELREGVTVKFSPPGGGTAINQLSSVEGIDHNLDDNEVWTTSFRVWPLAASETQSYWILGTSQLGTGTRLA